MIAINCYSVRFILFTSSITVNLHRQSFSERKLQVHTALWSDHMMHHVQVHIAARMYATIASLTWVEILKGGAEGC